MEKKEERWERLHQKEDESDSDFKMRQLFVKNSKEVHCPVCGGIWLILKWNRRPAKRLLHRKCPYCNPLGITIRGV